MVKILRQMIMIGAASMLSMGLSACTPGNSAGGATVAGAGVGGLLGAAAFQGQGQGTWIGALGGALLGGIVGNQIGQYMDRQDRANMQRVIVTTPVGEESSWTNRRRHITYTVRPVRNYRSRGWYCREYQTRVWINGRLRRTYGRACRRPGGSWRIVR